MALQLIKNGTSGSPDEYSIDPSGADPVNMGTVILDDTGTPVYEFSSVVQTQLLATTYVYTSITVSLTTETAGVNYELSLTGANPTSVPGTGGWGETLNFASLGIASSQEDVDVFVRTAVTNNGSVNPGQDIVCNIRIDATENQ